MREETTAKAYYPGGDYVDIVGFDFYDDNPGDKYITVYNELCSFNKPLALAEYGPQLRVYREENNIPKGQATNVWDNMIQRDFHKEHYPEICFFIRWGSDWAITSQKNAKEFMNDPWWVNLEQFKKDGQAMGWVESWTPSNPRSEGPSIRLNFRLE
jgi:mannan endo-1,4-beta-mannosidase